MTEDVLPAMKPAHPYKDGSVEGVSVEHGPDSNAGRSQCHENAACER